MIAITDSLVSRVVTDSRSQLCRLSWAIATAWTAIAPSAGAQAVIRGQVRSDSSRTAIPFAIVDLTDPAKSVQATISGLYQLAEIPAGRRRIVARAVGYTPLAIEVEVGPLDTLTLDLLLDRKITQLATLVATAPAPMVSGRMAEFEERRRKGFGRFLDRAALAKMEPAPLSDALRQTPGVQLLQKPNPCFGFTAVSRRGPGMGNQPTYDCGRLVLPYYCFMTVVVDGVRIYQFGDNRDPPDVSNIMAQDLQAVEIYRGGAELPPELNATGSACGVLVLWTRTGENPSKP